jgi:hypothetical protein
MRYLMLLTSQRVRVGSVQFHGDDRLQGCVKTIESIPAGEYIWELNGLLSAGSPPAGVSVIQPHSCQKMGKSPRLMTGPARFVNHSCSPNAALVPIPRLPVFVVQTLREIPADHEVVVNYGAGYWAGQQCHCVHCSTEPPQYRHHVNTDVRFK